MPSCGLLCWSQPHTSPKTKAEKRCILRTDKLTNPAATARAPCSLENGGLVAWLHSKKCKNCIYTMAGVLMPALSISSLKPFAARLAERTLVHATRCNHTLTTHERQTERSFRHAVAVLVMARLSGTFFAVEELLQRRKERLPASNVSILHPQGNRRNHIRTACANVRTSNAKNTEESQKELHTESMALLPGAAS